MYIRVDQNSKKFSKCHGLLIYFVPTWMQAISAKKKLFFCILLAWPPLWKKWPVLKGKWGKNIRKMQNGQKTIFWYFYLIFPWARAIFFNMVAKPGKCKKNLFFAKMAFTHVGTKYIKRPWDFENFLVFWCTLIQTLLLSIKGDQEFFLLEDGLEKVEDALQALHPRHFFRPSTSICFPST